MTAADLSRTPRIDLWVLAEDDIVELADRLNAHSVLEPHEAAKLNRLLRPASQRHYLGARILARFAVGRYVQTAPDQMRFSAGPFGRPALLSGGVDFNLTHTDGLVACAVTSAGQVGVDAERCPARPETVGLAPKVLTAQEREALDRASDDEKRVLLAERWVLKEAYVKALGLGLHRGLGTFEVEFDEQGRFLLFDPAGSAAPDPAWQLKLFDSGHQHVIAVVHTVVETAPTATVVVIDAVHALTGVRSRSSQCLAVEHRVPLQVA